jgi:hypothetical protein
MDTRKAKFVRDVVLFVFGLLGIAYETIVENVDRPTLIVLFGACLGLPAFLHRDEKQNQKLNESEDHAVDKNKEILP